MLEYICNRKLGDCQAKLMSELVSVYIQKLETKLMLKGHGIIRKVCGRVFDEDYQKARDKLPDNQDFNFIIVDTKKNRKLPYTQYLFAVVYKYLSDVLPGHPDKNALNKYFESKFAPKHTCTINGEQFTYCDLKNEKIADVNAFIEKVVEYVRNKWDIEVPNSEDLREPENRDFFSQAYLNQDIAWNSVISSLKLSKDNGRRNNKTKRF